MQAGKAKFSFTKIIVDALDRPATFYKAAFGMREIAQEAGVGREQELRALDLAHLRSSSASWCPMSMPRSSAFGARAAG